MFNSAQSILDKYIDTSKMSRFNFYSVAMERGENPEDLYYLCSTKDHYYVVFETDYVADSLTDIAQEATTIFKEYNLIPLQWMVKKDAQSSTGISTYPIDKQDIDTFRKDLIADQGASPFGYAVRHAVIEFVKADDQETHRFHPTAYGNVH